MSNLFNILIQAAFHGMVIYLMSRFGGWDADKMVGWYVLGMVISMQSRQVK